jgi:hypothetical protein
LAQWPRSAGALARSRRNRAAHLDHDPRNNRLRNLKSLCQRCHMIHDRPHHLAQRRITYLLRRALGDLVPRPLSGVFHAERADRNRPLKTGRLEFAESVIIGVSLARVI